VSPSIHILARHGAPHCVVVVKSDAPAHQLAAEELSDHLSKALGGPVPITTQRPAASPGLVQLVIGELDTTDFADEEYAIQSGDGVIHFAGRDTGQVLGSPRQIIGQSSPGTLYAVYHFLDHCLGVRWLWPGAAGTHIPRYRSLELPPLDVRTRPDLEQRCLRGVLFLDELNPYRAHLDERDAPTQTPAQAPGQTPGPAPTPGLAAESSWEQTCRETILWGYRHHMGSRTDLKFTHSYPHWWETYGEDQPELFAHPPAGYEQPFPQQRRVKLCVSHPGVADTIIEEWRQAGRPSSWCVGPNDGSGWCTCDNCRALDGIEQDPEAIWLSRDVNLTGRYTHLWNELLPRLRQERADVRLTCYAYSTYRDTLPDTQLHDGMVLAVVHTYDDHARAQWSNWSAAGARLFLRPNWFHMGGCHPHLPLHRAGETFRFARDHGMVGFVFDSLMGYWATQGPFYYLIARLSARPDLSVNDVIDEYCSAFGAAAPVMHQFLQYWEHHTEELAVPVPAGGAVSQDPDGLHERACHQLGTHNHPLHASWRILPIVAHDEVLAPARALLAQARTLDDDPAVATRLDFLVDGLDHLAQLRDLIKVCYADELPTGTTPADVEQMAIDLAQRQDELTPRHVVWGALLRQTLERRNIRTARKEAGEPELDGI
jgi:hypothetical protein